MKRKSVYLVLCVLGLVIPYAAFIPWLLEHGLNLRLFAQELLANRVAAFFALDVIVSAIVLVTFVCLDQPLRIRRFWTILPALLLVGVSLAFPLFLLLREEAVESDARPRQRAKV